ncbi:hypothetical protein GCM10020000_11250 [Streptomyces olivoverticillatus]
MSVGDKAKGWHTMAETEHGFVRRIGLFQATAINMSQMCGIGPFVTIPLMVAAFGGPQAVIGFVASAVLALADGLIWAELGASLPGAGGSYVYLRQAFQYRTGRLMPFLFVWTAMLFIPLAMATGVIGFVQYLGFLWPGMTQTQGDLTGLALIAVVVALLWRRVENIARITTVLWAVMLASVLLVIIAAFTHFSPDRAFTYPAHAFALTTNHFWTGFAAGLTIGIYDYGGYNTAAYMGAEIKNPGRTLPRAIVFSIVGIMAIYLLLQVGTLGVVDWQEMLDPNSTAATSVASAVMEKTWGKAAADTVTVLILVTAFASVFTGLLGGSRVPYDAAREKVFFRPFGTLHPPLPLPGAAHGHHGSHRRCRVLDRPSHRPGDAHPAADHGDGHRPGAGPDRSRDGAAPPPAGAAPPVPHVALPAAEPGGARGLAGHLRLCGPQFARTAPHRVVAGVGRGGLCGLCAVGGVREGVAVRAAGDQRGVPGGRRTRRDRRRPGRRPRGPGAGTGLTGRPLRPGISGPAAASRPNGDKTAPMPVTSAPHPSAPRRRAPQAALAPPDIRALVPARRGARRGARPERVGRRRLPLPAERGTGHAGQGLLLGGQWEVSPSLALWAMAIGSAVMLFGSLLLGGVTHAIARRLGGNGRFAPTASLFVVLFWTSDLPRLVLDTCLPSGSVPVRAAASVTAAFGCILAVLLIRGQHHLPTRKAMAAVSIQMIAAVVLLKFPPGSA